MSNQEKIEILRRYRKMLVYSMRFEQKETKEKEPQKVLVLRKKWYGKNMKVA